MPGKSAGEGCAVPWMLPPLAAGPRPGRSHGTCPASEPLATHSPQDCLILGRRAHAGAFWGSFATFGAHVHLLRVDLAWGPRHLSREVVGSGGSVGSGGLGGGDRPFPDSGVK